MTSANTPPTVIRKSSDRAALISFEAEEKHSAERALIEQVLAGDPHAFYELVRPYERAVLVTALGFVKNEADAQDIAQEAMLKAFKALAHFRGDSKFSTWLIQIAINEARLKLRRDRSRAYQSIEDGRVTEDGDYVPLDFADWRDIPSEALERKEVRDALNNAVASLPERYRTVLMLRDVQQLSISETAQLLGLSEANVKTRLSRARLQLRDALAPGLNKFLVSSRSFHAPKAF